jgi:superfamily II DNA/RNA helicase
MEQADLAVAAKLRGDVLEASRYFQVAFRLESEAAALLADQLDTEPTRSVLFRSAASLALDCDLISEAEELIRQGLSGRPPAPIVDELLELLAFIRQNDRSGNGQHSISTPKRDYSSSDLTFLTNEAGNTLRDRFHVLLEGSTRFFDVLVGYFFVSGFYQLYPSLEKAEKIRVLVGLKADRMTVDLLHRAHGEQPESEFYSHAAAKEEAQKEVFEELQDSPDTAQVEAGIRKFLEWVKGKKLEIRAYPSASLHAKVYIMTFRENDRDKGRVITGSSNFTQAGLRDNLEFNVELKQRADYEFSLAKFNELWEQATELNQTFVDTIERKSPYAYFTPYELYLKFLYEYFKDSVNQPDELDDSYLPDGFKKLRYQEEAVLGAKRILEEYGGVFLSDVVGLGKTYMSAALARELDGRTLVIAPPGLLDRNNPGSWPNVFGDFGVRQSHFESIGKLEDLALRDTSRYSNVFIDESHRFRTDSNQTYEKLAQICRGKRVILVSATPLNNYPSDILSQIKLFQNGKNSTIPNQRNLEAFFGSLQRKLERLDRQANREKFFATVRDNASAIRECVLKYLMIRRTRSEITKYYGEDLAKQGLKFPEVSDPEALFYTFSPAEEEAFAQTIRLIVLEFKYARYKPLSSEYYKGDIDQLDQQRQVNLAKFMKILLVKRLESSIHAFRLTLDRFIKSYDRFLAEVRNGSVYISKKHIHKLFDSLDVGDEEAVQRLIDDEKAERYPATDFRPEFRRDLENDLVVLRRVHDLWNGIDRDPKWVAFENILITHSGLKGKLIIFTESKETAEYLSKKIAADVEPKVLWFSGQSDRSVRQAIIDNFDARAFVQRNDYRIVVTTDVLSEGVNLHRSNTVINYDIPWNPTRLMQRVGRVNRVDTAFDRVQTFNFFPSEQGNDLIKLKESAEAKIQAFIEMLGADARLLTEGEEVKSHDLFAQLNSKKTITGEDGGEESELEFLTAIRRVRDEEPDLFEHIKRLPKKARSTRQIAAMGEGVVASAPALLTYFRKGKLDKFYISAGSGQTKEIDFLAAVKVLKPADIHEARTAIPEAFYALLESNRNAFMAATAEDAEMAGSGSSSRSNDTYILRRLKAKEIKNCKAFTDDDEAFIWQVIRLLEDGALPKRTTRTVAEALMKATIEPLKVVGVLRRDIPREFFFATRGDIARQAVGPREVILSSFVS